MFAFRGGELPEFFPLGILNFRIYVSVLMIPNADADDPCWRSNHQPLGKSPGPQDSCFCVVGWNSPRTDSPETGFQVTLAKPEVWIFTCGRMLKMAGYPSLIKHGNGESRRFS